MKSIDTYIGKSWKGNLALICTGYSSPPINDSLLSIGGPWRKSGSNTFLAACLVVWLLKQDLSYLLGLTADGSGDLNPSSKTVAPGIWN